MNSMNESIKTPLYLQRGEEHHLLLGAVDLLVEDLPLGLLVDLVDPDGVVLRTQVVERKVLEPQQEGVHFLKI